MLKALAAAFLTWVCTLASGCLVILAVSLITNYGHTDLRQIGVVSILVLFFSGFFTVLIIPLYMIVFAVLSRWPNPVKDKRIAAAVLIGVVSFIYGYVLIDLPWQTTLLYSIMSMISAFFLSPKFFRQPEKTASPAPGDKA